MDKIVVWLRAFSWLSTSLTYNSAHFDPKWVFYNNCPSRWFDEIRGSVLRVCLAVYDIGCNPPLLLLTFKPPSDVLLRADTPNFAQTGNNPPNTIQASANIRGKEDPGATCTIPMKRRFYQTIVYYFGQKWQRLAEMIVIWEVAQ